MMLGGAELMVICVFLGGIFGYIFRSKKKKNSALLGIILGVTGSIVTCWLLTSFVYGSYLVLPVYAIFGAWLFNFIFAKIK